MLGDANPVSQGQATTKRQDSEAILAQGSRCPRHHAFVSSAAMAKTVLPRAIRRKMVLREQLRTKLRELTVTINEDLKEWRRQPDSSLQGAGEDEGCEAV